MRNLIGIFASLLVFACASLQAPPEEVRQATFEPVKDFPIDRPYQKCLYSPVDRTVFLLDTSTGTVTLFRDGAKINTIGGVGFDNTSFQKLSDIALAPDGDVLTLDSFQKTIKKFDTDGKYISSMNITSVQDPVLLAVSDLETFYVYDRNRREIVMFSDTSDPFFFGKFLLSAPTSLECNRESVWAYEPDSDQTLLFTAEGQYERDLTGHLQYSTLGQAFQLRTNWIEQPGIVGALSPTAQSIRYLHLKDDYATVLSPDHVYIWKITYASH